MPKVRPQKQVRSWKEELTDINPNTMYPTCTSEVMIVAEIKQTYAHVIEIIRKATQTETDLTGTCIYKNIDYQDTLKLLQNSSDNDQQPFSKLLTNVIEEVQQDTAPTCEQFANILKIMIVGEMEKVVDQQRPGSKTSTKRDKKKTQVPKKKSVDTSATPTKKMYFLLTGFYDVDLVEQLIKASIPLSCILEISTPGDIPGIDDKDLLLRKSYMELFRKGEVEAILESPTSSLLELAEGSWVDSKNLEQFWLDIRCLFDGKRRSKLLENVVYIRYKPPESNLTTVCSEFDIYADIKQQILQLDIARRYHKNYAEKMFVYAMKGDHDVRIGEYEKNINYVPPECATTDYILHCLIANVINNSRLSHFKEKRSIIKNIGKVIPLVQILKRYIKENQIVSIQDHYLHLNRFSENVIEEMFNVDNSDVLEITFKPYQKEEASIAILQILDSYLPILKKGSRSNSLPQSLLNKLQLEIWASKLEIDVTSIEPLVYAILFEHFPVNTDSSSTEKSEISELLVTHEEQLGSEFQNTSRQFKLKRQYRCYEEFPKTIMLQELVKTGRQFLYRDSELCPTNGAILFRFHDNLDGFGLNTDIWSGYLRTPVCFRDFCRFTVSNENVVLEKEELPKEEADFELIGYESDCGPVQFSGSTTTFRSLDPIKVTVDTVNCIGDYKRVSIDVNMKDYNFVLHTDEGRCTEGFKFHFVLGDGTVVVFSKPQGKREWVNVVERFVCDKFQGDFCNVATRKKVSYKEVRSDTVKGDETSDVNGIKKRCSKRLANSGLSVKGKCVRRCVSEDLKEPSRSRESDVSSGSELSTDSENWKNISIRSEASPISNDIVTPSAPVKIEQNRSNSVREKRALIKSLKRIRKELIPTYRVCSSRLHRHQYFKRDKTSRVELKSGSGSIPLTIKSASCKIEKHFRCTKLFPLYNKILRPDRVGYDLKMSLPSGLLIKTMRRHDDGISQHFINGCPRNKGEHDRIFTTDGNIIIRYCGGLIGVYSATGRIIHCDTPYWKVAKRVRYKLKGMFFLQNRIRNEICHRETRVIGSRESYFLQNHMKRARLHKMAVRTQISKMWKNEKLCPDYCLVSDKGSHIHVAWNGGVKQKDNFKFSESACGKETLWQRDDGVQAILKENGAVITQFPDGSRITTSFIIGPNLLYPEGDETTRSDDDGGTFQENASPSICNTSLSEPFRICDAYPESKSSNSTETDYDDTEEGWVIVYMVYRYEHENYATVIHNTLNKTSEIILPNQTRIQICNEGMNYVVSTDDTNSATITESCVELISSACSECNQQVLVVLNVEPLYKAMLPLNENLELLKCEDTYDKTFVVRYSGKCTRNSNFCQGTKNRAGCRHDMNDTEKLLVLRKDGTGIKFVDKTSYNQIIKDAVTENPENTIINKFYSDENGGSVVDLHTIAMQHRYEKYLLPYGNEDLVFKHERKSGVSEKPAYISTQRLFKIRHLDKNDCIRTEILQACEKQVESDADFLLNVNRIAHQSNEKRGSATGYNNGSWKDNSTCGENGVATEADKLEVDDDKAAFLTFVRLKDTKYAYLLPQELRDRFESKDLCAESQCTCFLNETKMCTCDG